MTDKCCQSGSLQEISHLKCSGFGWTSDAGKVIIGLHTCIAFPEYGCTIDGLGESRAVKIDLIEEDYIQSAELPVRGIDKGHEVL